MPTLHKRSDPDFTGGQTAGTVVGLVGAVLVFLIVGYTMIRNRNRSKRLKRTHQLYSHQGYTNKRLQDYERNQQSRIRNINERTASRRPSEMSYAGGARGRAFGSAGAGGAYEPSPGPPPSYNAALAKPPVALVRGV